MRIDELHKFSDGTLNDVRTALNDRLKRIRIEYLPQTIWRQSDKDKAGAMIKAIDKQLKTRMIMRSLEKFVDKMDSIHFTLSMYYDYGAHVKRELLVMMKNFQNKQLENDIDVEPSNNGIELVNDLTQILSPKVDISDMQIGLPGVVRNDGQISIESKCFYGIKLNDVDSNRKEYVTLQKALSENEKKVAEFIWRACNDGSDIVFKSKDLQVQLGIFKSLFPNVEVAAGILDIWSLVLNHEEKYREKNSGGGNIYIIVNLEYNYDASEHLIESGADLIRRRSIFESNITAVLSQSPYESFHDVDLTAEINIIDNLDNDVDDISVRYCELPIYLVVRHRYSNPMIQPELKGSTQGYPLDSVKVLRFYTLARNPVKEILLKLNLPITGYLNMEVKTSATTDTVTYFLEAT
ncbi:hypothetical protein Tco_0532714 [Tanacetum coccineum]